MPPIIDVRNSFRFAIGGNRVVEFPEGVHAVSAEVAEVAVNHLKTASVLESSDKVLPPITKGINGEDLGEEVRHLEAGTVSETPAE